MKSETLQRLNEYTAEADRAMSGGDGSPDSQNRINEAVINSLNEIYRILRHEI